MTTCDDVVVLLLLLSHFTQSTTGPDQVECGGSAPLGPCPLVTPEMWVFDIKKTRRGLGERIYRSAETRHVNGRSTLGIRWPFVAYAQHSLAGRYACAVIRYYGR